MAQHVPDNIKNNHTDVEVSKTHVLEYDALCIIELIWYYMVNLPIQRLTYVSHTQGALWNLVYLNCERSLTHKGPLSIIS